MPVIYDDTVGDTRLIVWDITETEQELSRMVTQTDMLSARRFKSEVRKLEHIAARAALRVAIPQGKIEYHDSGAPYVAGTERHISISHSKSIAAAAISENKCAVDIERKYRQFAKVRGKYISDTENAIIAPIGDNADGITWCAKEALYKYSGQTELDLIRDIHITGVTLLNSPSTTYILTGTIKDSDPIEIKIIELGEYIIAII